jgi:hypothetical protein
MSHSTAAAPVCLGRVYGLGWEKTGARAFKKLKEYLNQNKA